LRQSAEFDGVVDLALVKPFVEQYMEEVHERRQQYVLEELKKK